MNRKGGDMILLSSFVEFILNRFAKTIILIQFLQYSYL